MHFFPCVSFQIGSNLADDVLGPGSHLTPVNIHFSLQELFDQLATSPKQAVTFQLSCPSKMSPSLAMQGTTSVTARSPSGCLHAASATLA